MLQRFEVEGFKNFRNRLCLDFTNVRDYHFNSQCISDGTVSKAIVYGKNASGKTNLGLAMFDIVSHLTAKNVGDDLYQYYLNADGNTEYASFRYVFRFDENQVDYSYSKNGQRELISEALKLNNELIFAVNKKNHTYQFEGIRNLSSTINLEMQDVDSILRYIIANTVLDANHPLRKMNDYVNRMLWLRNLDHNRYIGYKTESSDYYSFIYDRHVLDEFMEFLQMAGINDRLIVLKNPDGNQALYFDKDKPLSFFKTASSGTRALYTFFYWYKTAREASVLFLDEFDAFYHYELAETIVKIVEKMSHSLVILTSHNTNLLTNKIMRPDCYFILSGSRIVSIADATDRELREGHNLEKLYKSGEFNG